MPLVLCPVQSLPHLASWVSLPFCSLASVAFLDISSTQAHVWSPLQAHTPAGSTHGTHTLRLILGQSCMAAMEREYVNEWENEHVFLSKQAVLRFCYITSVLVRVWFSFKSVNFFNFCKLVLGPPQTIRSFFKITHHSFMVIILACTAQA